jgi:hypothetical protein
MIVHVFVEFDEMHKVFAFGTFNIWKVIILGVVGSSFCSWIKLLDGTMSCSVIIFDISKNSLFFFSL